MCLLTATLKIHDLGYTLTCMVGAYIHEQMHTMEENILLDLGAWSDQ